MIEVLTKIEVSQRKIGNFEDLFDQIGERLFNMAFRLYFADSKFCQIL